MNHINDLCSAKGFHPNVRSIQTQNAGRIAHSGDGTQNVPVEFRQSPYSHDTLLHPAVDVLSSNESTHKHVGDKESTRSRTWDERGRFTADEEGPVLSSGTHMVAGDGRTCWI